MLGREVSAETYGRMEQQLRDARMLDLMGVTASSTSAVSAVHKSSGLLSDIGVAELINMPGLTDTLEAIFTDPDTMGSVTEAALLQLKAQCRQCKCVLLGREISTTAFIQLRTQALETQRVDLTTEDYAQVSSKGLSELGDMFPQLVAVFTSPSRIRPEVVEAIRPSLPAVRCLGLGREVSADVYETMERQLEETRMLDLTNVQYSAITDVGFAELVNIPGLCGNLEALFTCNISFAALDALKQQCSWAQCVFLGQEIDMKTFQMLRAGTDANTLSVFL